jgi:hypothetical protein
MFRQSFFKLRQTSRLFRKGWSPKQFSTIRTGRSNLRTNLSRVLASGLIIGGIGSYYAYRSNTIWLDSEVANYVQPETKVKPFPVVVERNGDKFRLLGTGVRTVSFLSLHVYAIGIYIGENDLPKLPSILNAEKVSGEELEKSMLDPDTGSVIISKLLNSGVNLSLRIVPVRGTDFGHLKDGFVRSIMGHPRFKTEGNTDQFGEGLNQLKRIFSRKRNAPKNRILHLTRDERGILRVDYFDADSEEKTVAEPLGMVTEPLVSELLFLRYLSGKDPSSAGARKNSIERLVELATIE